MNMKDIVTNDRPDWNMDMEFKLKRFPIVLHHDEWMKGTGFHVHPGLEIHVTLEGTGTMIIGKQVLLQSPRSVLVFRGTVPHQMISKSSYKRTVVSINYEEADDVNGMPSLHRLLEFSWIPLDSCLNYSLRLKEYQQLMELCKALQGELQNSHTGWQRMALSFVLQMTVLLQRSTTKPEHVLMSDRSSEEKPDLVQLCSDYVCSHLGADLSLRTVANQFSVSEEHLTRSFTREMDISFYQYVLLQRIAEAKRILRQEEGVSITDIAYATGFTSSSHFSRQFKALTEETPSSYRRKMKA